MLTKIAAIVSALSLAPVPAHNVTDSWGLNTHLDFPNTPYANLSLTEADINYSGLHHVRDFINSSADIGVNGLWHKVALATGSKFDAALPSGSPAVMKLDTKYFAPLAAQGDLEYIENGNEEDMEYAIDNGNSLAITAAYAPTVMQMAKQLNVPAINMSVGQGWVENPAQGHYGSIGNLTASCSYANAHVYPATGNSPGDAITMLIGLAQLSCQKPVIITELGWYTDAVMTDGNNVVESVQAKYLLSALFDAYKAGAVRTYIYELFDQKTGDTNPQMLQQSQFGLFHSDGSPKLAGTALHNLTTLLADSAASFVPKPLSFQLTGMQGTDTYFLMQKSDGSYWLALWSEARLSGTSTAAKLYVAPHDITIAVKGMVTVYDPMLGSNSVSTGNTISLPDHLILVRIDLTSC